MTGASRWNLQYISQDAVPIFEQLEDAHHARTLTKVGRELLRHLRHEHVMTRRELVNELYEVGEPVALMGARACVVTKKEHRVLDAAPGSSWERYKAAGIRVWDRSTGDWLF